MGRNRESLVSVDKVEGERSSRDAAKERRAYELTVLLIGIGLLVGSNILVDVVSRKVNDARKEKRPKKGRRSAQDVEERDVE